LHTILSSPTCKDQNGGVFKVIVSSYSPKSRPTASSNLSWISYLHPIQPIRFKSDNPPSFLRRSLRKLGNYNSNFSLAFL
jgi:hypothetical protein